MEKKERQIRVLLGKPGLCGHDRGVLVLAMALRDAGMEVIYSGRHNSPEQIVEAAIQEDVDILGPRTFASLPEASSQMKMFRSLKRWGFGRFSESRVL